MASAGRLLTWFSICLGILSVFVYPAWRSKRRLDGCCPLLSWDYHMSLLAPVVVRPRTLEDITSAVKLANEQKKQVNLAGSGHSWLDIAVPASQSDETNRQGNANVAASQNNGSVTICMRCYSGLVSVDSAKQQVTVLGGTLLRQLVSILNEHGLALVSFPSTDEQTVAGALATGVHGSNRHLPALLDLVTSFELVTADGSVHTVTADGDPDLFYGVPVSMGLLGIITEVTLQAVANYNLLDVKTVISSEEFYANLDTILDSGEYVKFWKETHSEKVLVYAANHTTEAERDNPNLFLQDIKMYVFEALIHAASYYPPSIPYLMRFFVAYGGVLPAGNRVGSWDKILLLPNRYLPPHLEAEYAVPVANATQVIRAYSDYVRENGIGVNSLTEIRFVAGDDFWLSNNYQFAACHVTLMLHNQEAVFMKLLKAMEEKIELLGARPHWAKRFVMDESRLKTLYPRWDDFIALKRRLDPTGMFCHAAAQRIFTESRVC